MKLVECVPNFSEGRDRAVIEAIAAAIRSVGEVELLDVDPGAATNRTVYTFAGEPEAALEAAFRAIKTGAGLIDMRGHAGAHARQGACDVCPFVPISNVMMEECVILAQRLGRRVGEELGIPVYLYAHAAKRPERRRLPDIRAGEYEALPEKLQRPEWRPDFGPAKFNAKSGATAIGARNFLVAYNVNLNTSRVKLAKEIAFDIRESGRLKRGKDGEKVLGKDGTPERVPGLFRELQATGWLIPEYGRAQVTINILDLETSPLHLVYDACSELAGKLGLCVTGSEIVGMAPRKVLRDAGLYFLQKQGSSRGVSEEEIIRTAILSLGLSDVAPFDPKRKIIEERFEKPRPLASLSVEGFLGELASSSPAPGGGSAAALAGALSASLSSMVAALTFEKKGFEERRQEMERIGMEAHNILRAQLRAVDDDTAAFNRVMEAMSLPKESDEQRAARSKAIEEANQGAAMEPLRTLERMPKALELARALVRSGNPNSLSDAGVAALLARAAAVGAYYNVAINLGGMKDEVFKKSTLQRADELFRLISQETNEIEEELKTQIPLPSGERNQR